MAKKEKQIKGVSKEAQEENEYISKSLHDIHTQYTCDGETSFVGRDEWGKEFHLTVPTIELLHWCNVDYWKEKSIEYIKQMKC